MAQGRVALQELRQATPSCSGSVGVCGALRRSGWLTSSNGVFTALHGQAAAKRVHQASWPDVHLIDQVADFSHATLPQIVEKAPPVRIRIVGASLPSNLLTAYREIPKLVRLLQQLVPDAQVTFVAECASNIDVEIRDGISRVLNI